MDKLELSEPSVTTFLKNNGKKIIEKERYKYESIKIKNQKRRKF